MSVYKRRFLWLFVLHLISCEPANKPIAGHLVQLKRKPAIFVKPGKTKILYLKFQVANSFHILANQGNEDQFLATQLKMKSSSNITTTQTKFPTPKPFPIEGVDEPMKVFDNLFEVKIQFKVAKDISKGEHTIEGNLFYQACNSKKCFFPKELTFKVTIFIF